MYGSLKKIRSLDMELLLKIIHPAVGKGTPHATLDRIVLDNVFGASTFGVERLLKVAGVRRRVSHGSNDRGRRRFGRIVFDRLHDAPSRRMRMVFPGRNEGDRVQLLLFRRAIGTSVPRFFGRWVDSISRIAHRFVTLLMDGACVC